MKTGILAIALLVGSSVYGQVGQDLKNVVREEYAHLMREALDTSPATDMVFTHFVEHMTDEESQTLRAALRRLSRKRRA